MIKPGSDRNEGSSAADARRWNARYQQEGQDWLLRQPHQLLLDTLPHLPRRGIALDAAAGVGRDSRGLAAHGLRVVAADISLVALRLNQRRARSLSLPISCVNADMSNFRLSPGSCDVIVNFYFLERAALPMYRSALKPGGWLIFETFVTGFDDLPHPDYYLQPGELRAAFPGWETVSRAQEMVPPTEGHGLRAVERWVARKPAG